MGTIFSNINLLWSVYALYRIYSLKQNVWSMNLIYIYVKTLLYNYVCFFFLIVTGDKRKRQEVDSDLDFSEECILGNSDNIYSSIPKKQKGKFHIAAQVRRYFSFKACICKLYVSCNFKLTALIKTLLD